MIFRRKNGSASPKRRWSNSRLDVERLEDRRVLATVVLNTDTGVAGELRTEIAGAAPGEAIEFMLSAGNETITLTQGQLVIDNDLIIDGANTAGSGVAVTLDANAGSRVMNVDDGIGTINTIDVTIHNLTLTGGRDALGGGLINVERLTLDNVDVIGNTALAPNPSSDAFGGGILNNGALTLHNSRVEQNSSQFAAGVTSSGSGGGIASTGVGSSLTLVNSSVSFNEAIAGTGGGIFTRQSTLTIDSSTISSNRAGLDTSVHGAIQRYDYGGGIAAYSQGAGAPLDVTITNTTIADNVLSNDGLTSAVFPYGGGFFAKGQGAVDIRDSTIAGNSATGNNLGASVISRGGGVWIYGHDNGMLTVDIQNTTVDGNFSYNQGGGIGIRGRDNGPVLVTIDGSSISNNIAGVPGRGQGGGIFHWALNASTPGVSQLRITNSTLSGNMTVDGSGGVIRNSHGAYTYIENSNVLGNSSANNGGFALNVGYSLNNGQLPPKLLVRNSTMSGNSAYGKGGAIYSYDANLELYQSTISGNDAYLGGALYLATFADYVGTVYETYSSLERSTITLNEAYLYGGGIYTNLSHTSHWANSIISGNTAGFCSPDVFGNSNITYSYNYIGGNAMLGTLADNGGPTSTHVPAMGSPVIDAADPGDGMGTDQRGYGPRDVGGRMDIGSVEVGAMPAGVDGDFNDDGLWDCTDINLLTAAVASGLNDPDFDMNGDGIVDGISTPSDVDNDLVAWLERAGMEDTQGVTLGNPFIVGDANLDGVVDGLDFIQWNSGKFTSNTPWCGNNDVGMIGGNFNGDQVIDGLDFILWNAFKFQSSAAEGLSNSNGDRLLQVTHLGERGSRLHDRAGAKIHADDDAARAGRAWILGIPPGSQRDDGIPSAGLIHSTVASEIDTGSENNSRVVEAFGTAVETVVSKPDINVQMQSQKAFAERLLPRHSPFTVIQPTDLTALDRVMAIELGQLLE